jgi:HAE1 family hydrophobic/amphiphilic exporter-1
VNLVKTSLQRPVATAMVYLIILATGLFSLSHLPLELTPEVDFPRLSVLTQWPNSSPEMVELFVTSPIEAVAATVTGVRKVRSTSEEGLSTVEVEFERGTNMDFATFELNEKLAVAREELPYGAFPPQIQKYVPKEFQTDVLLSYRLLGPFDLQTLRRMAKEKVRPPLLGLEGVADIRILGGVDREVRIEMDPRRMEALGVSIEAVQRTLQDLGLRQAAGHLVRGGTRWELLIDDPIQEVASIGKAVIPASFLGASRRSTPGPVRLEDVAQVSDASSEPVGLSRINGQPAVTINIEKEPGTSTIAVAQAVEKKLTTIAKSFPPGLRLLKERDQSLRMRKELRDFTSRAGFCLLAIFAVLLLFLRRLRAPLVILATILFSVLLTVDFFYFAHLTLNLLTMAGLALGFGMLVDNSIVVLDSVERQWRRGQPVARAAERGASEVALAVVASTLTTVVVFLPFLYMTGELRIYYLPFALAVGLALVSSLVVAFTLTPMLAAKVLFRGSVGKGSPPRGGEQANEAEAGRAKAPTAVQRLYARYLRLSLRHKWFVAAAALALFVGSFYIFDKKVPRGQPFSWGRDTYLVVYVQMPSGSELEATDAVVRSFEEKLVGRPHLDKVTAEVYPEWARLRITFPPEIELTPEPLILKEKLSAMATRFAGANVNVYGFGPGFFRGGGAAPRFYLQVLGYNYNEVKRTADEVGRTLRRNVRVRDLETSSTLWYGRGDLFEVIVRLDRRQLSRFGLTVGEVLQKVEPHIRGARRYQRLKIKGEDVDHSIKMHGYRRFALDDLRQLVLRSDGQEVVRLGDVASISEQKALARIVREDQQYQRWISFEFRGPWRMGDRLVESVIRNTHLPPGYSLQRPSFTLMQKEEEQQVLGVLALAILLVFMVTAALYESLRHPFVVLLTVPLALIGVFWIFYLTKTPFDRSAYIGVILLGGIVVNNAIVLVDHINRLRTSGRNWLEAVSAGCMERARPIMMTTATTVFGMLPLVLFVESKQGLWYSLALATIGGLTVSSALVLTVTPALYAIFRGSRHTPAAAS